MTDTGKFAALEKAIVETTKDLEHASIRTAEANREETRIRNKLNEAQKTFDAAVAEMRKVAPRMTAWTEPSGREV